MNVTAIVASVFRLYALWVVLRLLYALAHGALIGGTGRVSDSLYAFSGATVYAVFSGCVWVYAAELGRWAYANGRSPIETAMKCFGLVFALSWSGHTANLIVGWLLMRLEPEPYGAILGIFVTDTSIIASMSILVLSILMIVGSRWVGLAVLRAERMRELRAKGG